MAALAPPFKKRRELSPIQLEPRFKVPRKNGDTTASSSSGIDEDEPHWRPRKKSAKSSDTGSLRLPDSLSENSDNNAVPSQSSNDDRKSVQQLKSKKNIAAAEEEAKSRRRHRANDVCGIIKKLHVVNFMCHKNLSVDFNRHLNFITGRNGCKQDRAPAFRIGIDRIPVIASRFPVFSN